MPELPEVRTVAKVLKEKIIGKKITNYQIRYQNIIEDGSLSFDNLINKTILDITTYGKYLIFKIDNLYLVSHLRMEGKYYIKNIKDEISKHEHIIFILDGTPEVLYQRKKELPIDEISRQKIAYLKIADKYKNAVVINVDKSLDDVVSDVTREIFLKKASRSAKAMNMKIDTDGNPL